MSPQDQSGRPRPKILNEDVPGDDGEPLWIAAQRRLGELIDAWCSATGNTRQPIAEAIGKSKSTVTKIYTGDRKTGKWRRAPWREVEIILRVVGEQGELYEFVRQYGAVWDEAPKLTDPRLLWTSTPEGIVAPPHWRDLFSPSAQDQPSFSPNGQEEPEYVRRARAAQAHAERQREQERAERERAEREEQAERERAEREEQAARDKAKREKAARERAEQAARDKAKREKAARERAEQAARDKAEQEKAARERAAKARQRHGLPRWAVLPLFVGLIVLAFFAGPWGDAMTTWLRTATPPDVVAPPPPVLSQTATVLNDRVALRDRPLRGGVPVRVVNSRDVVTVSCAQVGERVIVAAEKRVGERNIRDEVPDAARIDDSDVWLRTETGSFVAAVYVSFSPAVAAVPDCLGGPDRRVYR